MICFGGEEGKDERGGGKSNEEGKAMRSSG